MKLLLTVPKILCVNLAFLLVPNLVLAFPAQFALGPNNNQSLTLSTIQSAKRSLNLNVYQLDNPTIVDAIIERIQAGVTVNLLIEGHPVGGIGTAGQTALTRFKGAITQANNSLPLAAHSHLYLMSGTTQTARRFRFDHAKYMIVDSEKALVSSENLTFGGHPDPGYLGSRGWDILLEDSNFSAELTTLFTTDVSFQGDIQDLTGNGSYPVKASELTTETPDQRLSNSPAGGGSTWVGSGDVQAVTLITSPHSLEGLTAMILSAKKTIEVQEMTLPISWRDEKTKEVRQNPILTALIEASRRGVQVRVLMNDDSVFSHPKKDDSSSTHDVSKNSAPKNEETRQYVKRLGFCEKLPIYAELIDVTKAGISYIHNKGFIIDGEKVLISSINGTNNSVNNNREVAVLVTSKKAAAYFGTAFSFDWKNSLIHLEAIPGCSTLSHL